MRMRLKAVVGVLVYPMMYLPCRSSGIDVKRHATEVRQMMKKVMPHFARDLMAARDRQITSHRETDIGLKAVPDPPRPHVGDVFDAGHVPRGVVDLVERFGFHTVEHARYDGARRLPHEHVDRGGDQQANDGIGERESRPHTKGAKEDREACPAVDAGMVAVRDQRRAADLATNTDAK